MGAAGGGRDARFIDRMVTTVIDRASIDPERVAVGGFSDGASYALLMGLTNGSLFKRIIAFSPGYLAPSPREGKPRLFVSHGTADTVLPIARCSRVIVPMLRREGYDVDYVEFEGGHRVLPEIRERAMQWLASS
jgi:phospholipase/carboxylesterase